MKRFLTLVVISAFVSGCAALKSKKEPAPKQPTPQEAFLGGILLGSNVSKDKMFEEVVRRLDEILSEINVLKQRIPAKKFGKGKLKEGASDEGQDREGGETPGQP